jgi:hypothetical protein
MIMTCIIGEKPVYHKPLFDNSVVAPDDGAPKRVGYNTSAYRCYRGSKLLGTPTKYTPSEAEKIDRRRLPRVPAEKLEQILQLRQENPKMGMNKIARLVGVSNFTVWKLLTKEENGRMGREADHE